MPIAQPSIFEILATDNGGTAVVLTFEGTGFAGGQVTIYDGVGNAIASTAVANDGSFSISTPSLANGAHSLTLTTTDTSSNESAPTDAIAASVATGGGTAALQSLDISQLSDQVVIDVSATSSAVTLTGNGGSDTFFGNDGGDTVNAGNGGNNISTGAGNDIVNGGSGGDTILTAGGADNIHSGGNSSIDAGDGDDTVQAGGGDTVFGGKGSDAISGSATDAAAYGGGRGDYLIEHTGAGTWTVTSKAAAPEFGSVGDPGADSLTSIGTLLFGYDPITGNAGASVLTSDLIGLLSDTDNLADQVDETSPNGTAVHVTAHAVDGSGDTVSYQLLTAGVPFAIDSTSGVITVAGALDHVSHPSYDLEVEATSADGSFTRAHFTVTVTGADIAPVNTVPGAQSVAEDANLVFSSGSANAISVSDADAGSGIESVTLSVLHGTLTLGTTSNLTSVAGDGTANVSLSGTLANLNAALSGLTYRGVADFNGGDTLSITTNDGGNTGTGGPKSDTDTVAITVTAVNDAPVNTVPGAQSVNEDTDLAISGLAISDVDAAAGSLTTTLAVTNGTLTVAAVGGAGVSGSGSNSVTLTGTLAQINAALAAANNVIYHGASNFNGADTLTMTTSDGGNTGSGGTKSDTDTVAINVISVDDTPTGAGFGSTLAYLENQSATVIDSFLTLSDPDNTTFTGARVAISANYQAGQDVLGFVNQNGITGSFNSTIGVLTLSGTSSLANYQTALASVTYFNSSDNPSVAQRTVDYQVNDGSGLADLGNEFINVIPINDPPVITSNGGGDTATISVAENTTAVTTVVASDPDSPTLTYSIVGGSDAGQFQINASTGALSFITAPDFEIPTDSDHNNTYVVQVRASDGSLSDSQTITVSVTNVNDPLPTLHWTASVDVGAHPAGWLPAGLGDFNNDGASDLAWFNAANGDLDIWKLANGQWTGSSDLGSHPAGYQPAGFGDFNHDGASDVLWYNATTRDVDLWKISNGQWAGSVDLGTHPAGYLPSGVGDFNHDGTSDILWFNATTRDAEVWLIQNGQWAGSVDIGTHPAGYQPAAVGDFNGDGTSDVAWFNSATGDLDIWTIQNGHWAGSSSLGAHPAGYQVLGAGDFNKDGVSDIVWYNRTNNDIDVWLVKNSQWAGSVDLGKHPAGSVAVGIGDVDHNGVSDIMWRDTTTGHIENWLLAYS